MTKKEHNLQAFQLEQLRKRKKNAQDVDFTQVSGTSRKTFVLQLYVMSASADQSTTCRLCVSSRAPQPHLSESKCVCKLSVKGKTDTSGLVPTEGQIRKTWTRCASSKWSSTNDLSRQALSEQQTQKQK